MAKPAPHFSLQRSPVATRRVVKLLLAGAALTVIAMVAWPIIRGDRQIIQILTDSAMPAFLLVLVLLVAVRHERRWAASVNVMSRLLAEFRGGEEASEAASESLAALGGRTSELTELAESISTLCRDLKAQKQAVAALETVIQRHVATRTDTLEKKLGALREEASRDALTGVSNRGAFDSTFPAMFERARRESCDLCVVMIDIDYFKELNDTLGHWAGDDYLRKVGQLIRAAVREQDEAFRYGGDEFVLLLWNTSDAAGRATAQRLCRLAEELSRTYPLLNRPRLSFGVVSLHETRAAGADELLRLADEGLYRLKHARKTMRLAA